MSKLADIKTAIKTLILDPLVTATTLGEVQVDDFSKRLTERDFTSWPAAVLTTPSIDSSFDTTSSNLRTYTFVILVMLKADNVQNSGDVEDLMLAILDKVDENFTLGGEADGGVDPSVSTPGPLAAANKSLIAFTVTLKAKATNDFRSS